MRGPKDAALGLALRTFLDGRLSGIGEILTLSVDTAAGQRSMRLALRGEARPVDLDVRKYALDQTDGRDWLTIVDVAASRAWLDASLRRFAVGRPFPVSVNAARALRLLT